MDERESRLERKMMIDKEQMLNELRLMAEHTDALKRRVEDLEGVKRRV